MGCPRRFATGPHRPRRDGVDADTAFGELLVQAFQEGVDRSLGHDVLDEMRGWLICLDGRRSDDGRTRSHVGDSGFDSPEHCVDVGFDGGVELLVVVKHDPGEQSAERDTLQSVEPTAQKRTRTSRRQTPATPRQHAPRQSCSPLSDGAATATVRSKYSCAVLRGQSRARTARRTAPRVGVS